MFPATLKGGRYVAALDPSTESLLSTETVTLILGLVKNYVSNSSGSKTISAAHKCRIITPKVFLEQNAELTKFAEDAYQAIEDLGFSFEPRTSQIEINFVSLGDEKSGAYYSSKLGINWSNIEMNYKRMTQLTEMKRTLLHEMMHLVNAIYDPRWYFTKAVSPSNLLWMDEALATWMEEFVTEGASSVQQDNCLSPIYGFFPSDDTIDTVTNHGYGMAALIKYLAFEKGNTSIVKLAQAWKNGATSVYDCFQTAYPDLFTNYNSFLSSYMEGIVYACYKSKINLFQERSRSTIEVIDDKTSVFSVSLDLKPYSAHVAQYRLSFSDLGNKQIEFTSSNSDGVMVSLYKYNATTHQVDFISDIDRVYNYTQLSDFKTGEVLYVAAYNKRNASDTVEISAQIKALDDPNQYKRGWIRFYMDEGYVDHYDLNTDRSYSYTSNLLVTFNDLNPQKNGKYTQSGKNMVYTETWDYTAPNITIYNNQYAYMGSMMLVVDPVSKTLLNGWVTHKETCLALSTGNLQETVVSLTFQNIPSTYYVRFNGSKGGSMEFKVNQTMGSVSSFVTHMKSESDYFVQSDGMKLIKILSAPVENTYYDLWFILEE